MAEGKNTKQRFGRHDVVHKLPASTDQGEDARSDNAKLGAWVAYGPSGVVTNQRCGPSECCRRTMAEYDEGIVDSKLV